VRIDRDASRNLRRTDSLAAVDGVYAHHEGVQPKGILSLGFVYPNLASLVHPNCALSELYDLDFINNEFANFETPDRIPNSIIGPICDFIKYALKRMETHAYGSLFAVNCAAPGQFRLHRVPVVGQAILKLTKSGSTEVMPVEGCTAVVNTFVVLKYATNPIKFAELVVDDSSGVRFDCDKQRVNQGSLKFRKVEPAEQMSQSVQC